MKYVLAKDIFPLGRKGEKVTILQNLSPHVELKIEKNPKWGIRIWSNDIQHLIRQGLIEEAEAKPREFQLVINKFHDPEKMITLAAPLGYKLDTGLLHKDAVIIKVREVLE